MELSDSSVPVSPIGEVPKSTIKPWSCGRAKLFVKTAEPGKVRKKERLAKLREDRAQLQSNLPKAPYIGLAWGMSGYSPEQAHDMTALIDTGADWSLIAKSELEDAEWGKLQPSNIAGEGVTREQIPIIGEVWRTLFIKGVEIPDQRFIVVEDMITPVILGADFWGRLGEFSLNFKEGKLKIKSLGIELDLQEASHAKQAGDPLASVLVCKREVHIPPFSEMLLEAELTSKHFIEGEEVFIEPISEENSLYAIPYTVATITNGAVPVKIANLGCSDIALQKGSVIGTASQGIAISSIAHVGRAGAQTSSTKKIGREELLERCGDKLDEGKREQMVKLLMEFEDIFYKEGKLSTVTVGIEHEIKLKTDAEPVAHRPRRLSPDEEKEVRQEIEELTNMGVIRQSNSPWAAPIVCARKSNGKLRLAIDFRGLNAVSVPANLHPIPRIDDLFDRLGEARFFSVVDAKSGYHQLPLRSEDSELTAFVVPWGQFEFIERTPFGLKGAGYSFQRLMSSILGSSNFRDALCYLDDVLVWSQTWEEHIEKLSTVLGKIRHSNLKLGLSKCQFGVDEVEYLGSTIKNGMLAISEQRVETLRSLPRPATVTELRRALGAFAFIQRWLPGLAAVNGPLYEAVGGVGRRRLTWTKDMAMAFSRLKDLTANAVALKIPDMERTFVLVTDGSDQGVGALLAQEEGGELVPVAFYHHALAKAQKKYNTTEKELLAVVLAIKKFRIYLGKRFRLITDHAAITYMKTMDLNDEKGRKARWVEYLQQYDMELIHRSGKSKEMSMADYLSRITPLGEIPEHGLCAAIRVEEAGELETHVYVSRQELLKAQGEDEETASWANAIREGQNGQEPIVRRMKLDEEGLLMILYSSGRRTKEKPWGIKERWRVVVPGTMRGKILQLVHCSSTAAHMGQDRTYHRCRQSFWWDKMNDDVIQFVNACEMCGKNKHVTNPNRAPLQIMDIPLKAFEKLQIDFMGPYQASTAHPYRYTLQIQDILSRFLMLIPTEKDDSQTAAEVVFEDWVCRFGVPKVIQSDRGTHFASETFRRMCVLAGIDHVMGSPGHAQSQGQVERQNQLSNQVRCLTNNDVDKWPKALCRVSFAHNLNKNATTDLSPYQVVFGTEPRTIEKLLVGTGGASNSVPSGDEVRNYHQSLTEVREAVQKEAHAETVKAQEKRAQNSFRKGDPYEVGDLVRIKLGVAERGKLGGKKMAPQYSDVYKVKKVLRQGWSYILKPLNGVKREKQRHFNNLKEVSRCSRYSASSNYTPDRVEREQVNSREDGDSELQSVVRTVDQEERQSEIVVPQEESSSGNIVGSREDGLPEADTPASPEPARRSSRNRRAPIRFTSELAPGGRQYLETAVPLAEDAEGGVGGEGEGSQ